MEWLRQKLGKYLQVRRTSKYLSLRKTTEHLMGSKWITPCVLLKYVIILAFYHINSTPIFSWLFLNKWHSRYKPLLSVVNPQVFKNIRALFTTMDQLLISAWISNHIYYKMWDEIIYQFPNFNGAAIEVWEWISNFIPHFIGHVISYPWWDS